MRILSLTNCPLDSRLGSGKTVLNYTQGLRQRGHEVAVYSPAEYQLWPQMGRASKLRQALGAAQLLNREASKADLLEFYGDEYGFSIWQLSKQTVRPFLVAHTNGLEILASERERLYTPPPSNPVRRFYSNLIEQSHDMFSHLAFGSADGFVALCELDRRCVVERGYYPLARTAVVEPGLDAEYLTKPFNTNPEERVAFTGSWIDRKDITTLAAVMVPLLTQRPTLRLDLYGTGAAKERVLSYFPATVHGQLYIAPRLTETAIAEGLSKARVFFFPTQYEGFGIALAEAMACGCAAVTTPTGFGAELIEGKEVWRCAFGDQAAMTHAITQLLDQDDLWLRIAQGGYERTRTLTWERNIDLLDQTYRQWQAEPRIKP